MSKRGRPRTRHDPLLHPVRMAMRLSEHDHRAIQLREQLALAELESGAPSPLALHELRRTLEIGAALAARGIGPEAAPIMSAGLQALTASGGAAVAAVRDAIEAVRAQRCLATRGELLQAVKGAFGHA